MYLWQPLWGRGSTSWADEPEIDLETPFSGWSVLEALPRGNWQSPHRQVSPPGPCPCPSVYQELLNLCGSRSASCATVPSQVLWICLGCSPSLTVLLSPPGERPRCSERQLEGHLAPNPQRVHLRVSGVGLSIPRAPPSLLKLGFPDVSNSGVGCCSLDSFGPWNLGGSQVPEELPLLPLAPNYPPP